MCSPPALLRAGPTDQAASLDGLHHSLHAPLLGGPGYLGGSSWGNLGSPPVLEGLGSMLKSGGGFMGGAEPTSLHSLLCGVGSPAVLGPPSAYRGRGAGLHAHGVFSPHRCDLSHEFHSPPHSGLPSSTPFAPHPSRLGEPSRAGTAAVDAPLAQPQRQPQPHVAPLQGQGQQPPLPGAHDGAPADKVEEEEVEAPQGLGGLCSTPCMHSSLLPCGSPSTLLPGGSACYGGLQGLDGGLHGHAALASPASCLPGSSSRHAAAAAVGACNNPWGAVLMGALCSPGGLAPPPTIPRSHGKGCAPLLAQDAGQEGDASAAAARQDHAQSPGPRDGGAVKSEAPAPTADGQPGGEGPTGRCVAAGAAGVAGAAEDHKGTPCQSTVLLQAAGCGQQGRDTGACVGAAAAGSSECAGGMQAQPCAAVEEVSTALPGHKSHTSSNSRAGRAAARDAKGAPRTAAGRALAQRAVHSPRRQQLPTRPTPELHPDLAHAIANLHSPACKSPRLDVLAGAPRRRLHEPH